MHFCCHTRNAWKIQIDADLREIDCLVEDKKFHVAGWADLDKAV